MKTGRLVLRLSTPFVIASALLSFQTFSATASTTVSAKTTDSGPVGATGIFVGDAALADPPANERLLACDKQDRDGKIAYAYAEWKKNGEWQFLDTVDTDGASEPGGENGCHEAVLPDITEETTVHVYGCLKDSVDSAREYCGEETGKA